MALLRRARVTPQAVARGFILQQRVEDKGEDAAVLAQAFGKTFGSAAANLAVWITQAPQHFRLRQGVCRTVEPFDRELRVRRDFGEEADEGGAAGIG